MIQNQMELSAVYMRIVLTRHSPATPRPRFQQTVAFVMILVFLHSTELKFPNNRPLTTLCTYFSCKYAKYVDKNTMRIK